MITHCSMATAYTKRVSDQLPFWAHPSDLKSDFCTYVDEFITAVQNHKAHISSRQGKDALAVTEKFTQFWQDRYERINLKWNQAIKQNPRYETGHITRKTYLTKSDIYKGTKIFSSATNVVFEKEWVYMMDLIVAYASDIYRPDDIYFFCSNWKEFRQHIIDLWSYALEHCHSSEGIPDTICTPLSQHDYKHSTKPNDEDKLVGELFKQKQDVKPIIPQRWEDQQQSARPTPTTPAHRSRSTRDREVSKDRLHRSVPAASHQDQDPAKFPYHSPQPGTLPQRTDDALVGQRIQHNTHHLEQIESLRTEIEQWKEKVSNLEKSKSKYRSSYHEMSDLAQSYETENKKLVKQLEGYKSSEGSTLANHDYAIQQRDYKIEVLQQEQGKLQKRLERKMDEVEDLQEKLNELQKNIKAATYLEERNTLLEKEKSSLMDQLSASMNRQMSRDETNLENINVKNRPMKILQEYEMFCSQEWLDAKGDLDDNAERAQPRAPLSDGDRCTLLCMVLNESYKWADDTYEFHKRKLSQMIGQFAAEPLSVYGGKYQQPHSSASSKSTGVLDKDFEVCLAKMFKQTSDKADFTSITADVLEPVFNKQIQKGMLGHDVLASHYIQKYATAALSLCWRMVIQQPPMTLDSASLIGKPMPETLAEPHFGSTDPKKPTAFVQYYVYPAIFHGGNQMKKARVFLGDSAIERRRDRGGSVHKSSYHRSTYHSGGSSYA